MYQLVQGIRLDFSVIIRFPFMVLARASSLLCDLHTPALSHFDSLHTVSRFLVSLPRLTQCVERVVNK
jgi:hypothetical protein